MDLQETFYNKKCDCCGVKLDDEHYWQEREAIDQMMHEEGWKHLGGQDYCHDCWQWDDDDNIVTKDGRKFTEAGEEIKTE